MASFSERGIYWHAQVRRKGQEGSFRTFDTKADARLLAQLSAPEQAAILGGQARRLYKL
jgi:hypothetical protein